MIAAMSASHSRAADSVSVSSTVCRSKVERLMTLSTSAVAVCCSDSERSSVRWRSSLSSRVFSIAITACAAKFCNSSMCFAVNGRDLLAINADDAKQPILLEHRHDNHRSRSRSPRSRASG